MSVIDQRSQGTQVGSVVAPQGSANKSGRVKSAADQVRAQGEAVIESLTDEERAIIGSKSNTVIFKVLLGLASKRSNRRVSEGQNNACSTPIAGVYVLTEDAEIPRINVELDNETGIDPDKDITWVLQKAGEEFDMTHYEFMYFITQPQYAGEFAVEGNSKGGFFSAKLPNYLNGKAKLPTPVVNIRGEAIKANIVNIDEKVGDKWQIKEEYKERYGALIKPRVAVRTSGAKKESNNQHSLSIAIGQMIKNPRALKK